MKTLIIAEKPSVGRDIARVLKCSKKDNGYLYSDNYIVSWAIGHLVTLCDPHDYSQNWKKWSFETLPIIPEEIKTKSISKTKEQLNILKKLMNNKEVDSIICATDSGREGELIFRYIYYLIKCKKPFKRLWISSMTDTSIIEGFKNLKESNEYDNLYLSAKCRSEADWLVGINASRAFTVKYNRLLSIGRVQTPTLAIIVKRQKEIESFVPKDYWEVEALFNDYKGLWIDIEKNDTKIFEKEKAENIVNAVRGSKGIVKSIENEEKKQLPPLLYDLTELQRDCNKRYSFSAQKTLSIAQDLYEKRKLITYPRTDSRYLSDDMISKINLILKKVNLLKEYNKFADYILNLNKIPINKRIIDNSKITDHHAIIPTDINIYLDKLSSEELKVYDLIVRRFLQVFYPNYIYNVTKIITYANENNFITKGTTIIQLGWLELNQLDSNDKKENDILPDVKENMEVKTNEIKEIQKKTQPPKVYNEAMLLSAMENAGRFVEEEDLKEQLKDSGLGTPATRASIIERLLKVGYIERKGKNLIPTEKGMKLVEIVPQELKSPETTGKWEKGLTSISKGKMDNRKFMESIIRYVNYIVEQSKNTQTKIDFPEEIRNPKGNRKFKKIKSLGKCPKCNIGEIFENTKAFYCSNWKDGCKFTIWKNSIENYGGKLTENIISELIKNNKIDNFNLTLPQTSEKCTATLSLKSDKTGLEIINLNRISQ